MSKCFDSKNLNYMREVGVSTVISIANQKGGVGKTTSAITLAYAISTNKKTVLLIDLDPQASLTDYMGFVSDGIEKSVHDVLLNDIHISEVILKKDVHLLPSNIDLSQAEVLLMSRLEREHILRKSIKTIEKNYDFIIIDCPPSLGILSYNAMVASNYIIIPVMTDYLSMRGIKLLLDTISSVKDGPNSKLQILGIIPTIHESNSIHCKQVLNTLINSFSNKYKVFKPVNKSVKFKEAPVSGKSILSYSPDTPGAKTYKKIAMELIKHAKTKKS